MSGILQPGRVQIGVVEHHNGQAFPSSTGIGQQFHIFGGLTKLEWMAGMVFSGAVVANPKMCYADFAHESVDIAEIILAECAARQAKDVTRGAEAVR